MKIVISHDAHEVAEALKRAPREVAREVDKALRRGAVEVTRSARDKVPKAESELVQSIQPQRISQLEHHIRAAKAYASFVEDGTGPGGWVPLAKMLRWVARKGLTSQAYADPVQLAKAIQRKIVRSGTPPQPFMAPALKENTSRLDSLLRAAVARGLAQVRPGRAL